jgi:mannosyltransferase
LKFSRAAGIALFVAAFAAGAYLRLNHLGGPSYWLDEILGDQLTTQAARGPWWRWLTGLEREHGPLYYATQVLARFLGRDEGAGRMPAALLGVLTIPLVFIVARKACPRSPSAALAATIIFATSPLHVYYSREARPYSLLIFLIAVVLVLLSNSRLRLVAVFASLLALLYTTAVAGPALLAVVFSVLLQAPGMSPHDRRRRYLVAAGALIALALLPVLYSGVAGASSASLPPGKGGLALGMTVLRAFTVSALAVDGRLSTAIIILVFALIGLLSLVRENRPAAGLLGGMAVLPVAFALVSLAMIGHWFAPRYVSAGIMAFVVLAGVGVEAVARLFTTGARRRWPLGAASLSGALAMLFAILLAADTVRAADSESRRKLDWRAIAATLEQHVRAGDTIIAAEPWSATCLRYYASNLPSSVRLLEVNAVIVAKIFAENHPATWLVTAGYSDNTAVREYMCGLPLLLASPLEEFRLHYAPSVEHFLQERSGPAEVRAVDASLGVASFVLHIGAHDRLFLRDGWGSTEGERGAEFRWIVRRGASLVVPRGKPGNRFLRFHALPFANPTLPPQRLRVSLNGVSIGGMEMSEGWHDYEIVAPTAAWREGLNTLSLTFLRTGIPARIDARSTDGRTLAAAVDRLSIIDAAAPETRGTPLDRDPVTRMASDDLFATRTGERSRHTRFPPRSLDRGKVQALLGRAGFDPQAAWPRIERDQLRLEDIASAIAFESACEGDEAFLRRAFETIVERAPNPYEELDLMARLRGHDIRTSVANRVLRAGSWSVPAKR